MSIRGIMDERDVLLKISIVEKMTDKETLEDLYRNEPFLCDLLLDNFKLFFNDGTFRKLERQITLLKFLKNKYPIELVRKVLSYVEKCDFSEDYRKIIMEWNYQASEYIKQDALSQYDGQLLTLSKKNKKDLDHIKEINNQTFNIIDDITRLLSDKSKEE